MSFLYSTLLALALFSKIPMPQLNWEKKNMRFLLAAFPLLGLVSGLVLWAWLWLADLTGLGPVAFAAGLALLPLAVTGGIHLDGFCDTVDALASHASPEKKQEVLKDPHAGAFAVIAVAVYLLAFFALSTELARQRETVWLLGLVQVLSRTTVGFGVLHFSPASSQGLFFTLGQAARKKASTIIRAAVNVLTGAGLFWLDGAAGLSLVGIPLLFGAYIHRMSRKQFGGMSGDLSGYWLQSAELAMLAGLVIIQKVVAL